MSVSNLISSAVTRKQWKASADHYVVILFSSVLQGLGVLITQISNLLNGGDLQMPKDRENKRNIVRVIQRL